MNNEWDKFNETVAFLSDMTNDADSRRLSIEFFTNHLKKFQIEQKELKKKRTEKHLSKFDCEFLINQKNILFLEMILAKLHCKKNYARYIKSKLNGKMEVDFWLDNGSHNITHFKLLLYKIFKTSPELSYPLIQNIINMDDSIFRTDTVSVWGSHLDLLKGKLVEKFINGYTNFINQKILYTTSSDCIEKIRYSKYSDKHYDYFKYENGKWVRYFPKSGERLYDNFAEAKNVLIKQKIDFIGQKEREIKLMQDSIEELKKLKESEV